jgi:hypothetical protein
MTIGEFNKLTKKFPQDTEIFFNLEPINATHYVAKSVDKLDLIKAEDNENILLLQSFVVGELHSEN